MTWHHELWEKRGQVVGKIFPGGPQLDMGGGDGRIRKYTKPTKYVLVDKNIQEKDTIYADFNKDIYPQVDKGNYIITAVGLLEYLHDVPGFMSKMHNYGDRFIFTYWQAKEKMKIWANHYTYADMIRFVQSSGWKIDHIEPVLQTSELIFVCGI